MTRTGLVKVETPLCDWASADMLYICKGTLKEPSPSNLRTRKDLLFSSRDGLQKEWVSSDSIAFY
jgi:hypothetical protein